MNVASVIVVFVVWWWISFLALLPLGVESRWEGEDDGVEGADPGAPRDPQIKKKALRATLAAAVLTVITSVVIISGVFNFRD